MKKKILDWLLGSAMNYAARQAEPNCTKIVETEKFTLSICNDFDFKTVSVKIYLKR